ncbi:toll like receptor [Xylocopa sonorina]|uniref:toll like receptor n=1 Tax=Xylocopa sonorina TaxID=1818115 RepID=UPI00403AC768
MIGSSRRLWSVLWIVFAACFSVDSKCPKQPNCICHSSSENDFELQCSTRNELDFIVNVEREEYIQIRCHMSSEWSNFHLSNLLPTGDIKSMHFKMCDLPTNESLGEIASKLGARNVEHLVFQSRVNLTSTLEKKHLMGFPKLKHLVLFNNGLTNLSADLFEYLPNLSRLILLDNNVRLTAGIFDSTPNLTVLELGSNRMKSLESNVFDPLSKLRFLNLWKNNFEEIKPGTFDKLVSLNSLDLNSNDLITLPKDIFAKLEKLEALNLYNNNFAPYSLPEGLLRHNVKLQTINLSSNKRNMTTLPDGLFMNLTELEAVQLRRNGLIQVPADLFRGCVSLRNISLERNYIEWLPEDLFENLTNLSLLDLNFNELTSLPDRIFSTLKNLSKLDLSKNHLTSISRHLFSNLKNLQVLDMQENQLKTIEDTSFYSLLNLRVAIFSNNQLTLNSSLFAFIDEYGPTSPFHKCKDLEELHLRNNNISQIFKDWVLTNSNLRKLDLSFNQIKYIETPDLQFFSNTIEVDLRHNQIEFIDLQLAEGIAISRHEGRNVIILIDNNPIVCDCNLYNFLRYLDGDMNSNVRGYFNIIPGNMTCQSPEWIQGIKVTNLTFRSLKCEVLDGCPEKCSCWRKPYDKAFLVDCSHRNLTSVPRSIKCLPGYHFELNLSNNKLTRFEIDSKNKQISKLLLSNNNIYDISVNELPLNMKVLELDNNNITRLNSDVLSFMNASSMTLTLHDNPWTCDCNAIDFLNFVQTKVNHIINPLLIKCKDGTIPMLKMIATDLCPTDTIMIVGASLAIAISGLIIGLLAALYYRYQQEIKVWLYAHQCCLWLVTEDELDKDKLYDAFISYSHKDEDFVVNELVPKLENGPRSFKLCLHFRDWLAGEWIPTQIARSVEDSKRTIVILSPNFLESVWGRMEFRAAHSQALSEGRARVILILYGEIGPTDDLDPELKAYLSMNTYVKWGDPWFWDKLRYALPHPPELTKNAIRKKIFEKHQPCIHINGEKKELIYPISVPETPPATSTPPADTLKLFICDEKDKEMKDDLDNLSPTNVNAKLICSPKELMQNNILNTVQCTTV